MRMMCMHDDNVHILYRIISDNFLKLHELFRHAIIPQVR